MRVLVVPPDAGFAPGVEEAVAAAVEAAGHEALAPLPEWRAGLAQSERNRFLTTVDRLLEADLLVADVSDGGASAAWCAAWMLARGRLAVLAARSDARAALSPMLAGNPSPWQRLVPYRDATDLRRALAAALAP